MIIFDFIKNILDKLFFYNCLYLKAIYSYFIKKLTKLIIIYKIKEHKTRFNK